VRREGELRSQRHAARHHRCRHSATRCSQHVGCLGTASAWSGFMCGARPGRGWPERALTPAARRQRHGLEVGLAGAPRASRLQSLAGSAHCLWHVKTGFVTGCRRGRLEHRFKVEIATAHAGSESTAHCDEAQAMETMASQACVYGAMVSHAFVAGGCNRCVSLRAICACRMCVQDVYAGCGVRACVRACCVEWAYNAPAACAVPVPVPGPPLTARVRAQGWYAYVGPKNPKP